MTKRAKLITLFLSATASWALVIGLVGIVV
jgi:hypothetical protein